VLAIIALSEKIDARIPGALIGLALASAAVVLFALESRGVSVLGAVTVTMPVLAIPVVSASRLTSLLSLSLIIAIVVMVQTAATTRSFPSDPNEPPDVDRDFVGVGVGSILSGLIGAFPVDASPPRTARGFRNRRTLPVRRPRGGGDRDRSAGRSAHRCCVEIPNAALGGVLLFVALRIIRVARSSRSSGSRWANSC
jgi:sulfate permease, SulP family